LHQSRVRTLQDEKKKNAGLIAKMKSDPQRLLVTILVGNNIVNILTASYAAVLATNFFGSLGLGLATGVTTILILIFGEVMPKSLAYTYNTKIALRSAKLIYLFFVIFYPITFFLLGLNRYINRKLRIKPQKGISEKEIIAMVRMGVESGAIDYEEHQLIENIFEFDDVKSGEVMTPLYKVKMLNGDVPVDQIAHFVSHSEYSRYPVYEGDKDNIIGYIHVNQIMKALNSKKRTKPIKNFILPIKSVPENRKVERVFRSMKKEQSHMYLVHRIGDTKDVIGLITLENILEEIVGEIADESDDELD